MKSTLGSILMACGVSALVGGVTGCTAPAEDDGDGSGGSTTSPSSSTTDATTSQGGGVGVGGDGTGGVDAGGTGGQGDDGGGGATNGSGGGSTGSGVTSCSQAILLAGNPYYTGDDIGASDPTGHGLREDPPLRALSIDFAGDKLLVDTDAEIWVADLAAEAPDFLRVAGDQLADESWYRPTGACADVQLLVADGVTALDEDRALVADIQGNGIIELRGIGTDACTATPIAGTQVDVDGSTLGAEEVHEEGDVDGPGSSARFWGPSKVTADDRGNAYFIDLGNYKVKRIADDADRTVSTIADLFDWFDPSNGVPLALATGDGKVFVAGHSDAKDKLIEIDPDGGEAVVLYDERPHFDELDPSQLAVIAGVEFLGDGFAVYGTKGFVWRLDRAGEPTGVLAGYGPVVDFPQDLVLEQPIPAAELPVRSPNTGTAPMARLGNDLYVVGTAGGVGYHMWKLSCE